MTGVASIGLLHLWDVVTGSTALDKFSLAPESMWRAGGILGIGITSVGVRHVHDLPLGLLGGYVRGVAREQRIAAILG